MIWLRLSRILEKVSPCFSIELLSLWLEMPPRKQIRGVTLTQKLKICYISKVTRVADPENHLLTLRPGLDRAKYQIGFQGWKGKE
jgi:hypothetical protein